MGCQEERGTGGSGDHPVSAPTNTGGPWSPATPKVKDPSSPASSVVPETPANPINIVPVTPANVRS